MRKARILAGAGLLLLVAAAGVGWATAPRRLPAQETRAAHTPDLANGRTMFLAGNCSACHMSPGQDDRTRLGGGRELASPFGVFVAPNISPDPRHGVGAWSEADFANAMKRGVDPQGRHLYPAFPYGSYAIMRTADVRDLFAYLKTLPAVAAATAPHRLRAPYGFRPLVGGWKALYFRPRDWVADPARPAAWNRGAYLVEGPAHCKECHTPRDALGGLVQDRLYAGAPNLEPNGRFATNITPHADGLEGWTAAEVADFLKTGTDRCFNEPVGMAEVIASTSALDDADLAAIAAYVVALPPKAGNKAKKVC